MRKIIIMLALALAVLTAKAQCFQDTCSVHIDTIETVTVDTCSDTIASDTIAVETYREGWSYTSDYLNDIPVSKSAYDTISAAEDYANVVGQLRYRYTSPGELLNKSGEFKNKALAVGVPCAAVSCLLVGLSFLPDVKKGQKTVMRAVGCTVAACGGIAAACLFYIANECEREAGLKMSHIQFTGNGVNVRF